MQTTRLARADLTVAMQSPDDPTSSSSSSSSSSDEVVRLAQRTHKQFSGQHRKLLESLDANSRWSWSRLLGLGDASSNGNNNNNQANQDDDTVEGCRISGTAQVNKVTGNLHITALGHGYLGDHTPHHLINFTHIIRRLQFGTDYPGLQNPLDETFQLSTLHFDAYTYFLSLVPTSYTDTHGNTIITNQYATRQFHQTAHDELEAKHIPGLFFRYNIEPISLAISAHQVSFIRFGVRVGAIMGGIWYILGFVNSAIGMGLILGDGKKRRKSVKHAMAVDGASSGSRGLKRVSSAELLKRDE